MQPCYENDLIPVDVAGDNAGALAVSSNLTFLPRIQLYGSSSTIVKQGKFPMGHFGLIRSKDNIEDLGDSFNALLCSGRAKALRIDGDNIITIYEHVSDEFKKIQAESAIKDSGCMYGPEFLLWVPKATSFATYFLCNPTGRNAAGEFNALLRRAATIKSKLIETKKFVWHGPQAIACSTPLDFDMEAVKVEVDKFKNAVSSKVKTVDDSEGRER